MITLPQITVRHEVNLNEIELFHEIPDTMTHIAVDCDGRVRVFDGQPQRREFCWTPARGQVSLSIASLNTNRRIDNWSDLCFEIERPKQVTAAEITQVLRDLAKIMTPDTQQMLHALTERIERQGIAP